jgi:hypothetical protein
MPIDLPLTPLQNPTSFQRRMRTRISRVLMWLVKFLTIRAIKLTGATMDVAPWWYEQREE